MKLLIKIDILITSRYGDRKIMQLIRITSGPPTRIRQWILFSQYKIITTERTCRLYFNDEPRVPESQLVKNQQPYIGASVAYPM